MKDIDDSVIAYLLEKRKNPKAAKEMREGGGEVASGCSQSPANPVFVKSLTNSEFNAVWSQELCETGLTGARRSSGMASRRDREPWSEDRFCISGPLKNLARSLCQDQEESAMEENSIVRRWRYNPWKRSGERRSRHHEEDSDFDVPAVATAHLPKLPKKTLPILQANHRVLEIYIPFCPYLVKWSLIKKKRKLFKYFFANATYWHF